MHVEVFELILMLLLAVLLSSILDQVVPRISSPLIQIALGIGIAMLAISPIEVNIDPELFLVLFIAPLLFSDALEADKRNLWENKTTIVSFAIGLVIVITLCVGFVLHWLVPSIPLAAAFALGAALGPTDAVAVQALKKEAKLGKREGAILQGEALINDASGVVSFQFAVAAAVTGAFSLANAATSFASCLLSLSFTSTNVFAKWDWTTSHFMCSLKSQCPLSYFCSLSLLASQAFWLLLLAALCGRCTAIAKSLPISLA